MKLGAKSDRTACDLKRGRWTACSDTDLAAVIGKDKWISRTVGVHNGAALVACAKHIGVRIVELDRIVLQAVPCEALIALRDRCREVLEFSHILEVERVSCR